MTKILIIDDSRFARSMIRKAIEALGYEAAEATNGREGLQMVASYQPDAVTVDLLMPELDGIGFLSALRETGKKLPVVVISANIQVDVRRRCEHLGAVFLIKPFKKPELEAALCSHGITMEVGHGT